MKRNDLLPAVPSETAHSYERVALRRGVTLARLARATISVAIRVATLSMLEIG